MDIKVNTPFVIQKSDEALGWGYVSHPVLYKFSNELLMVIYRWAGDVTNPDLGKAKIAGPAYSLDLGNSWIIGSPFTNRVVSFLEETTQISGDQLTEILGEHYLCGFANLSSGQIFCLMGSVSRRKHISQYQAEATSLCLSSSLMITSVGRSLFDFPNDYEYLSLGSRVMSTSWKAVELSNGNIVIVGYCGERNDYRSVAFLSKDGGRTFEFLSEIANKADTPWGNEGPCEPALALNNEGELLCVMRTGSSRPQEAGAKSRSMLLARSNDDGKTWTQSNMHVPGVRPKLLLMKNGVLVCAFGRPGNNLIFSLDGGHTWGNEIAITPADIKTSGYIDLVEVEPGRLLVVYDAFDSPVEKVWLWEPPASVNALWGVFVDVGL